MAAPMEVGDNDLVQENYENKRPKRKLSNPKEWKKNKIKLDKAEGKAHINHVGKNIPALQQREIQCRCKCFEKISEDERSAIFTEFISLRDHEKQNIYMRGCVSIPAKVRRRSRTGNNVTRKSYVFHVHGKKRSIKVCKCAFCALHGIKEARLTRKVLNLEETIKDKRGKHNNHRKISENIRQSIRDHIRNFPARESHYSRSRNRTRLYLNSDLTIAKMHKLYVDETPGVNVKYWLYEHIFNHEFNIKFGYPRSDICDKCELLMAQMKAAEKEGNKILKNNLKTEHEIHIRRGDSFNSQLIEEADRARNDDSIRVICMDYEKNLPLPLTGIGQEYYKRQLWLHNFCIHESVTEKATMYLYAEHYAGKGPNEVLSCLNHYITSLPQNVKELHIFADNCFSQNKNRYIISYLQHIASVKLRSIHVHYPIPGHSRMPCDRDFGRIEKKKKKKDRVVLPSQWVELIKTVDKKKPFDVVYVEHPLTDDLRDDGTPVIHVMDYKLELNKIVKAPTGVASMRGLSFVRGVPPTGRETMTGMCTQKIACLKTGININRLNIAIENLPRAYQNFLPIKSPKLKDIHDLLKHVHLDDNVTFYANLYDKGQQGSDDDIVVE